MLENPHWYYNFIQEREILEPFFRGYNEIILLKLNILSQKY